MKMRKKKHIPRKPVVLDWYTTRYDYPVLTSMEILANIQRVIDRLKEGFYGV